MSGQRFPEGTGSDTPSGCGFMKDQGIESENLALKGFGTWKRKAYGLRAQKHSKIIKLPF